MRNLLFILLIFLAHIAYAQEGQNEEISDAIDTSYVTLPSVDTSYVLMPSIEKSCKNIVFTDSMFRAWNYACVENIKVSLSKDSNDCLKWVMPEFIKGDNFRLSFCKLLNNDSLITKENFRKGFFIIEIDNSYSDRYLLIDKGKVFNLSTFHFRMKDLTWYSSGSITISKRKFYNFYHKIQKQNEHDIISDGFIVTRFSEEKIESFVFRCKGCQKCINQLYKLTGRYD